MIVLLIVIDRPRSRKPFFFFGWIFGGGLAVFSFPGNKGEYIWNPVRIINFANGLMKLGLAS